MEAEAPSMAASARKRIQGVWTQIRSMTSMEEDQWKESSLSRNSTDEVDDDDEEERNGVTLEGMMQTVFSSCTTGSLRQAAMQPGLVPSGSSRSSKERSLSPVRKPPGAHYCSDHARASHVVNALREQKELSSKRQAPTSPIEASALTKPFPVSSPKRSQTPALVKEIPAPGPNMKNIGTFDDGISAISAYTLEEMARQDDLHKQTNLLPVRSDLTQETFDDFDDFVEHNQSMESYQVDSKAENMARKRSNNSKTSRGTRSTRSSKGSKSTFESNWRRDEQMYWEGVAEKEEKGSSDVGSSRRLMLKASDLRDRSRSRSGELRKQVDATISTTASSSSGINSPFSVKHPHDTYHIDANDFFPSTETINAHRQVHGAMVTPYPEDPDRIVTDQEVLLLAHDSEIGEI